ncbi:MAG: hypothetical protein R6U46_07870 [Marinilabilia sp.]
MNTDKAVLVSLQNGEEEKIQTIESEIESKPHNPREAKLNTRSGSVLLDVNKKMTQRKNQQMHEYFEKIMHNLTPDAGEIYLFGPANTKKHFEKELKKSHEFSSKKLEVESADKMTRPQMIAKVKQHFSHNGNHGNHKN